MFVCGVMCMGGACVCCVCCVCVRANIQFFLMHMRTHIMHAWVEKELRKCRSGEGPYWSACECNSLDPLHGFPCHHNIAGVFDKRSFILSHFGSFQVGVSVRFYHQRCYMQLVI